GWAGVWAGGRVAKGEFVLRFGQCWLRAPSGRPRDPLSCKHLFGQRWAVVGGVRLGAEQSEAPSITVAAQGLGGGESGSGGADHEYAAGVAHSSITVIAAAGQTLAASRHAACSRSGGRGSSRTTTPSSSRWSNTSGATSTHEPAPQHLSSSTPILIVTFSLKR